MNTIYRTEAYSGSGCRDARDVMTFEMTQLGNSDILKYCLLHYPFSPEEHRLVRATASDIDHDRLDTAPVKEAVSAILKAIHRKTGKTVKSVLWLAGLDAIKETYARSEDIAVIAVDVYKPSDIILSDLGADGILFGYEQPPIKTASFTITNQ